MKTKIHGHDEEDKDGHDKDGHDDVAIAKDKNDKSEDKFQNSS